MTPETEALIARAMEQDEATDHCKLARMLREALRALTFAPTYRDDDALAEIERIAREGS